jgi:hypothetical protein
MKNMNQLFVKSRFFSGFIMVAAVAAMFSFMSVNAQTTVLANTTLKVSAGSFLTCNDNLVLQNLSNLDNSGTVILKKSLVNQTVGPDNLGTGTFQFSGSTYQSIHGQNIMQNMTVNNSTANIGLKGNTQVNGTLTLTNGVITAHNNHLNLGSSATVSGTPSSTKMVAPSGTGELRKEYASGFTGSFTYPVGDTVGGNDYSPVVMSVQSGTFAGGNYIGVDVADAVYPEDSITTSYITRYWTLNQSGITSLACSPKFYYVDADVFGTESDIYTMKMAAYYTTSIAYNKTVIASNELSAAGISTLSPWTGAAGYNGQPPYTHSLQGITWNTGSHCYDGKEYIYLAGNGTGYQIDPVASVEFIAGKAIYMNPGTTVTSGGYMWAHISTTFCTFPENSLVATPDREENPGFLDDNESKGLYTKVYPNPTNGSFTLELLGNTIVEKADIVIYGMRGEALMSATMLNEKSHVFSLSGYPVGFYFIKVYTGEFVDNIKILKTN